VLYNKYSI